MLSKQYVSYFYDYAKASFLKQERAELIRLKHRLKDKSHILLASLPCHCGPCEICVWNLWGFAKLSLETPDLVSALVLWMR